MEKLQPSVVAVLQHRHCKREVTIILMEACHQSTSSLLSFFMSPFCQWVRCAQVISIYGERFKLQRSPGAVWINLVFRIGKMSKWAKNILVTATDCGSKFLDLQHIWTHQYQIYIYSTHMCCPMAHGILPWPFKTTKIPFCPSRFEQTGPNPRPLLWPSTTHRAPWLHPPTSPPSPGCQVKVWLVMTVWLWGVVMDLVHRKLPGVFQSQKASPRMGSSSTWGEWWFGLVKPWSTFTALWWQGSTRTAAWACRSAMIQLGLRLLQLKEFMFRELPSQSLTQMQLAWHANMADASLNHPMRKTTSKFSAKICYTIKAGHWKVDFTMTVICMT